MSEPQRSREEEIRARLDAIGERAWYLQPWNVAGISDAVAKCAAQDFEGGVALLPAQDYNELRSAVARLSEECQEWRDGQSQFMGIVYSCASLLRITDADAAKDPKSVVAALQQLWAEVARLTEELREATVRVGRLEATLDQRHAEYDDLYAKWQRDAESSGELSTLRARVETLKDFASHKMFCVNWADSTKCTCGLYEAFLSRSPVPASAGDTTNCKRCGKPESEHRIGYSAWRCAFVRVPPPVPASAPAPTPTVSERGDS